MSVTAVLVGQSHNHLRYLVTDSGEGGTGLDITTTGAASPDLLTDSLSGPVRVCAQAFTNGLGILPAGALTQTQARAIWEAQNSDTVLGNGKPPRCETLVQCRSGAAQWAVDANVDGGGHPVVHVEHTTATAGTAYLDVFKQGAIGR
jgi:hypothetical protein